MSKVEHGPRREYCGSIYRLEFSAPSGWRLFADGTCLGVYGLGYDSALEAFYAVTGGDDEDS